MIRDVDLFHSEKIEERERKETLEMRLLQKNKAKQTKPSIWKQTGPVAPPLSPQRPLIGPVKLWQAKKKNPKKPKTPQTWSFLRCMCEILE